VSKDKFANKRLEQIRKDAGGNNLECFQCSPLSHYFIKWLGKTTKNFRLGPVRILENPLTTEEQNSVKILYASFVTQQKGMPSHRNTLHKTCQHHEAPRCVLLLSQLFRTH